MDVQRQWLVSKLRMRKYTVNAGDEICWVYTCDLGKDVGDNSMY